MNISTRLFTAALCVTTKVLETICSYTGGRLSNWGKDIQGCGRAPKQSSGDPLVSEDEGGETGRPEEAGLPGQSTGEKRATWTPADGTPEH